MNRSSGPPHISHSGLTQAGPDHTENQDALWLPPEEAGASEGGDQRAPSDAAGRLYALADGMGGHARGELASRITLDMLCQIFYSEPPAASITRTFERAVDAANLAVYQKAQQLGEGRMGTTLLAAHLQGDRLTVAHVGDSRLYLVRRGRATCLTNDHSVVGELARMKLLSPQKVREHDRRSVLNRAIGMAMFVRPDIVEVDLRADDRLLLCTDGIWSVVQDEEFARLAAATDDPAAISRAIFDLALARGSDDDLSVIAIHVKRDSYAIIPDSMLQIGDQFDRFQIQAHLAQGGMSDIYRAYDVVGRREVALKIPDKSMIGDPAQYERFQRELEIMNTLRHPAILHGLGSGQYNRTPYLATELVEGRSLREIIDTEAPVPPEAAVALICKIADGMAYCHANNVIHRDLKPENILVTAEGQPVIMDFGLALTKGARRVTYANLSATAGTPDYMAPEQVEGQRGDARTDVYALATILYELLAGQTPFTGDNNLAVMAQHLQGVAPRLDKVAPGVSPALAAVVARGLQREPDDRYPDMAALIEALDHPETADLSLLAQAAAPASMPFWRSPAMRAVAISVALMLIIVVLAVGLQALKAKPHLPTGAGPTPAVLFRLAALPLRH
jgi:serine/threonine protein phosphatase PrpC/tRNA A-37 threonylcarbamoyl transferase component Bud32